MSWHLLQDRQDRRLLCQWPSLTHPTIRHHLTTLLLPCTRTINKCRTASHLLLDRLIFPEAYLPLCLLLDPRFTMVLRLHHHHPLQIILAISDTNCRIVL